MMYISQVEAAGEKEIPKNYGWLTGGKGKRNPEKAEAMGTFRKGKEEIMGRGEMRYLPQVFVGSHFFPKMAM